MKIVVDLTPVLPGGQNGGVKFLALRLLGDLIALAPQTEFVLLTSYATDAELASLDAGNAHRLCAVHPAQTSEKVANPARTRISVRRRVRLALSRALPPRLMLWLERAYLTTTGHRPKRTKMLSELGASLLFSPFAASSFYEPGVPFVSLVHDVAFYSYPRSFAAEERAARHRDLKRATREADRLVCTSTFVQHTLIEKADVSPARIVTIQPRTLRRLPRVESKELAQVLTRLKLTRDAFLLYPGSFRLHKNHGMLLTAFGVHAARFPDSDLRLVCPGEPGPAVDELRHASRAMGLEHRVLFPGFVSETELAALYENCRAVVFPSLYEGLGLPIVEALAFRKPVLCAPYPSLREVAGDAAVYFDPRLLSDVVRAIGLAADEPAQLPCHGGAATKVAFDESGDMTSTAEDYLRLFGEVAT